MKNLIGALLILFAVGSFSGVYAERHDFMKTLDLSRDQQSSLKTLKVKYRSKIKEKREALSELQKNLHSAFERNAKDEELRASFAKIQNLERELEALRFDRRLEMRKVLTAEQRSKFHSMMKERRDEWKRDRQSE